MPSDMAAKMSAEMLGYGTSVVFYLSGFIVKTWRNQLKVTQAKVGKVCHV